MTKIVKHSKKGFSLVAKSLIIIIVLSIMISGVWYASSQWQASSKQNPDITASPSNSPTQNSSPTPSPSNSPSNTPQVTASPSNPLPNPTPTPSGAIPTPSPPPPPTPTPSPTPTPFPTTAATFDFDIGSPVLAPGQNTPLSQTKSGVTAQIVSSGFSIQNTNSYTSVKLSLLTGNYLYDNNPTRDIMEIRFNQALTSISFNFATFEFHGGTNDVPSDMRLTAYMDTVTPTPIGTATAHGTWPTGGTSYPEGTLTFNSATPFNIVRIELPYKSPTTPADYLIDNVIVTTM